MKRAVFLFALLAGCTPHVMPPPTLAAPAPQAIVQPAQPAQVEDLPAVLDATWAAQRKIVARPDVSAAVVAGLDAVDTNARRALRPWHAHDPHPTRKQIARARAALTAVKAFILRETPAARRKVASERR